ncbi:phage head closure protein [Anaerovibrio sp. JC8]|uniref:phage head closure protein n=1 Tax=Anaerovibrio sp. JC8 TaxID=1240085 RepID=UPI001301DEC3|nr:phage head closure protein [Anaerovibrio sp. JC8]
MKIGKMRYRVIIQYPSDTVDDYGNACDGWENLCTVWADITPLNGREYFQAMQATSETTYKIYIRYIDGISPKMRAVHNNQVYEIQAVLADQRKGYTTLMCKGVE